MLKALVITALVAAFVLFAAMIGLIVFSSEQPESDDHAKPPVAEQSDSKDGDAVIDKAAANRNGEAKKKREWYNTFREHPTDWLLVLFNGLLVLATVALFMSGEKGIEVARHSANAAVKAAQAAETSANVARDSFTQLERPYLFVTEISQVQETSSDPTKSQKFVSIRFKNFGRSPAIHKETTAKWLLLRSDEGSVLWKPSQAMTGELTAWNRTFTIGAGDTSDSIPLVMPKNFPADSVVSNPRSIDSDGKELHFILSITYDDAFGVMRTSYTVWKLVTDNFGAREFIRLGGVTNQETSWRPKIADESAPAKQ